MEAFLTSTGLVALAEIGDKTQLLSLLLAARYRRPWLIISAILVATLVNHGLASALGAWLPTLAGPQTLRWCLGLSFLLLGAWILVPDHAVAETTSLADSRSALGIFCAVALAFFLAEMGDKTQAATVALAARYADFATVVGGTTVGMLLANAPAVLAGDHYATRIPLRLVHLACGALFALIGLLVLVRGVPG